MTLTTPVRADEEDDRLAVRLLAVATDPRGSVWSRVEAVRTLGKLGPKAAAAAAGMTNLLAGLRVDELPPLQEALVQALGELGKPGVVAMPTLTRTAGRTIDLDLAVRLSIDRLLLAADQPDVPTLVRLLRNPDASQRLRAAKALAGYGKVAVAALSELSAALGDPDPDVRRAAVAAVRAIDPGAKPGPGEINVFTLDLKDPDESVRLRAAKVLGRYGVAAANAIPALQEALADGDADVRRAALEALRKIGPPP